MSSSPGDELTEPVPVAFDVSAQTRYPNIRGGDEIQKGVGFVRGREGGSGTVPEPPEQVSRIRLTQSHQERADCTRRGIDQKTRPAFA